ncbi:MAG: nitroreductase family protein [Bacillota bacterium]|jgi:nitroreductase
MAVKREEMMAAIRGRHSVRSYSDRPIGENVAASLRREIEAANEECGLRMALVLNEPKAFAGRMAKYGKFRNVKNYIAVIGKRRPHLNEDAGYGGERVVLKAQLLGLGTCWVGLTYSKRKSPVKIKRGEKLVCVIAVGYGEEPGRPHKSKSFKDVTDIGGEVSDAFRDGIEAALLAPTAVNQQKFRFLLEEDGTVHVKATGGFFSDVDLGIVARHFEAASGIPVKRY